MVLRCREGLLVGWGSQLVLGWPDILCPGKGLVSGFLARSWWSVGLLLRAVSVKQ